MEYETKQNGLFPNGIAESATHCDGCDEVSVCNCESNERVTPYFSDDGLYAGSDEIADDPCCKTTVQNCCQTAKKVAKKTVRRIMRDWKACDGKPYIRQTTSHRVDIYKSKKDTEPIDSFESETVRSYALCSLALLGAGLLFATGMIGRLLKK